MYKILSSISFSCFFMDALATTCVRHRGVAAVDARRVHLTMQWLVSFVISSEFGPRRATASRDLAQTRQRNDPRPRATATSHMNTSKRGEPHQAILFLGHVGAFFGDHNPEQLVLEAHRRDRKIEERHLDADLRRVVRVRQVARHEELERVVPPAARVV
jgi:hypothetical protein